MAVSEVVKKNRERFASNLVTLQKINNVSNGDLAAFMDISIQMISRYRSGKDFPSFERLVQLCKRFDCTIEEIMK